MTDARDSDADATRQQLIELFLLRSLGEVEHMRRGVPRLIAGDTATWEEVRFNARCISGTAKGLELGVLGACAAELASLADEKFSGAALDAHFLLSATTAIEMVAIELHRLLHEPGYR